MLKLKTAAAGDASFTVHPLMSQDHAAPAGGEMMESQSVSVRKELESTPSKIPVSQKQK